MKHILITGATGNVGQEVLRHLSHIPHAHELYAGLRNPDTDAHKLLPFEGVKTVAFDFEDPTTFAAAFEGMDTVFLLRPPHLSQVTKYFAPLVQALQKAGVREVLFLSVQGAEKSAVIPHHKIEKLLQASGCQYIFLRPGYFMQNLSTTLLPEIRHRKRLFVPAGNALFNWVDVANIGEAAAQLLLTFEQHANSAYELTGQENFSFTEVAQRMSRILDTPIRFDHPGLLRFYWHQRKQGTTAGMVVVMMLLHYLPRFQLPPAISPAYEMLSGKKPTSLDEFLEREKAAFL
jgi:uncharacterized protein YbjT (DUF2867 family)